MYIKIGKTEDITDDFLSFLGNRMFNMGFSELQSNRSRLKRFDDYFDTIFVGPRKIKAYDIIVSGLKNLVVEKTNDSIHIFINRNVKVPLTRDLTLYVMCMLIDKGNIELEPFPIFTKLFEYVDDNIDGILAEYSYGAII